jgi:rhodanese-related sulfurtransferase
VGLAGRYAEFVGGVIEPERPIVLVGDDGTAPEAKIRLARIGFDSVVGYLEHPLVAFEANPDELGRSSRLNVSGLEWVMGERDDLQLIDIRQPGETAAGVIEGALLIPLTRLNEQLDVLDASKPTVIYCAVGFRSSIAASRMKAAGFDDVSDLLGGYNAWTAARTEVLV